MKNVIEDENFHWRFLFYETNSFIRMQLKFKLINILIN